MDLLLKYPWLKVNTTLEDYVRPDYYDILIKEYAAQKISDLDLLASFVKTITKPEAKILELGFWTGRCTDVILKNVSEDKMTLVDLSLPMIKNGKIKYPHAHIIESDSISFLEKCEEKYNALITLWSFSHSVHQHIDKLWLEDATAYINAVLRKFISKNLNPGGKIFIIHFDTLSAEQRILTKQWVRDFKKFEKFYDNMEQSPSKQILDRLFTGLESENILQWWVRHYEGDAIEYSSLDNAMEVFMNFHLESYFNYWHPKMHEVVEDLEQELLWHLAEDSNTIHIKPWFFIYQFSKACDSWVI